MDLSATAGRTGDAGPAGARTLRLQRYAGRGQSELAMVLNAMADVATSLCTLATERALDATSPAAAARMIEQIDHDAVRSVFAPDSTIDEGGHERPTEGWT